MGLKFADFPVGGFDVSEFNGAIDWTKLTSVNPSFCSIRVGHGRVVDPKFKFNWQNAKGKTHRLPYWYMDYYSNHTPGTSAHGIGDMEWGKIQAAVYWEQVKNDPSGIVFLDIEKSTYGPVLNTVQARVLTIAYSFLTEVDALSKTVNGIYCSLSMISFFDDRFKFRPLWVAWYNEAQTIQTVLQAVSERGWTGPCLIWQYASDGDLNDDGVADGKTLGTENKFLDLNTWLQSQADWDKFIGGSMRLVHPLKSIQPISQKFGVNPDAYTISKGHNGIDFAIYHLPCFAMKDGKVIRASLFSHDGTTDGKVGYGRHIRIQHDTGVSIYGHMSKLDVEVGDIVKAGQLIGVTGGEKTDPYCGWSTGAHLHAEYRMDGVLNPVPGGYEYNAIDILPLLYIPEEAKVLFQGKVIIPGLYIRSTPDSSSNSNIVGVARSTDPPYDVYEVRGDWMRVGASRWFYGIPDYVQKIPIVTTPDPTYDEKVDKLWAAHPELHS